MKHRHVLVCLLLATLLACGAAAEGQFFEESFLSAGGMEEETFDEMFFGGEAFFAEELPIVREDADVTREDVTEDRSVLSIPGEESTAATGSADWMQAPQLLEPDVSRANTVKLVWEHAAGKLPGGVKYYVYERKADGTGVQVGVTAKKTLTLKKVSGGNHTYFVRAEYVNAKKEREFYGARSGERSVAVTSELWKKAPALTAERTGDTRVTLTWPKDTGASS